MRSMSSLIRVKTAPDTMQERLHFTARRWKMHVLSWVSATPSLEAYTKAKDGEFRLVKLDARFEDRPLPKVSVIDLREELREGNRSVLSRSLRKAIENRLECGEQAILFLNRRGYAGFVSCRSCGAVLKCPHCDVALTEHNNGETGLSLLWI